MMQQMMNMMMVALFGKFLLNDVPHLLDNPGGVAEAPATRMGGVRLGKYYDFSNGGYLYYLVLSALFDLHFEKGIGTTDRPKELPSPWSWCPTPEEIYNRIPSLGYTREQVAKVLRDLENWGVLKRAPYRGYSQYLVPEKSFAEEWRRTMGGVE